MKIKLMVMATVFAMPWVAAHDDSHERVRIENRESGIVRYLTHEQYFTEVLNHARKLRARGRYVDAGVIFIKLSEYKNPAPFGGQELLPGEKIAQMAKEDIEDMRRKNMWNDLMLLQLHSMRDVGEISD